MINPENVQKFKSYGFVLTPVVKSKNPDDDKKPLVNEKTNYKFHDFEHVKKMKYLRDPHQNLKFFSGFY